MFVSTATIAPYVQYALYGVYAYLAYRVLLWLLQSLTISDVADKYVLITGCDSGFGRELALRLDHKGFRVVACCLFERSCEELQDSSSGSLKALQLDVTDPAAVERVRTALLTIIPQDKGLWGLVNNAGIIGNPSPVLLTTSEDVERCVSVNMQGQLRLAQACFPLLRTARGRIVNMSSMNGTMPVMFLPYSLSKYGVEIMSDLMRREFRQYGISVSIIEPGANIGTGIQVDAKAFLKSFDVAPPYIQEIFGQKYRDTYGAALVNGTQKFCLPKGNHHGVTDAYIHALSSRFPRTRYLVGVDAHIMAFLHTVLPVRVFDFMMESTMGLLTFLGTCAPTCTDSNANSYNTVK